MGRNTDGTSRRDVLRKTAITGSAALAGITAVSGSAAGNTSASYPTFGIGDEVRLTRSAATSHCCPEYDSPMHYCDEEWRPRGDEGVVTGECAVGYYKAYNIRWDSWDPRFTSWVMQFHLEDA